MSSDRIEFLDGHVYHAARGFSHHLEAELGSWYRRDEELYTVLGAKKNAYWTRNVWEKPFLAHFESIKEAASILRGIQRNWAPYPLNHARRCMLLSEALPPIKERAWEFPFSIPDNPMGAYTLLDKNTLLASAGTSSPWPNGQFNFLEDREGPPSRAYRKLWEALLHMKKMPGPGQSCIDAGASPGSWTWALAKLGASITAIDRSPLAPEVAAMPGVSFIKHNAFTLKPSDFDRVDWLCSDIISYPGALYEWIEGWLESGKVKNYVCTIKMQGVEWDAASVARFASIPGSKILHLWHNRHELTWMLSL